jgi:hypothetical protein
MLNSCLITKHDDSFSKGVHRQLIQKPLVLRTAHTPWVQSPALRKTKQQKTLIPRKKKRFLAKTSLVNIEHGTFSILGMCQAQS